MQGASAEIVACIPALRRYARGLTGNRDAADDLVQDALERAWSRIALWQQRGDLRSWLFSILHNRFVDRVRAQRARPEDAQGEDEVIVPARAKQSDMLEVRDLDAALARLPPEQREVLLLVAVEQMKYEEVAATLSVPVGTVMSRLSRARERLRAILEGRETVSKLKVGHNLALAASIAFVSAGAGWIVRGTLDRPAQQLAQIPPCQNCCRLHRTDEPGGAERSRWPDLDKHSRIEQ